MPLTELRRQLAWLIGIRAIISTVLLGSATLLQINAPGLLPVDPSFFLIGLTFALTVLWAVTLRFVDRFRWLVDLQLSCDVLIVSAFIFVTGGITSYFSLLYVLPIVAAATVEHRRGGLVVAAFSTVIYGSLVLAQYHWFASVPGAFGRLDAAILPPGRIAQYTVAINVFAFFAVAALSGSLAEGLRRAGASLERASSELATLQAFNQDVIDSLMSGLITADYHGRILTFNRAAEAITGNSAGAAVGQLVAGVLQLPPEFAAALSADLGGERGWRAEFTF
ncbi:MAG: hypothetical protein IMZ44_00435, partial [Planctomycetes bacterium]|nr:hypothetical protein [Planctomycetota bacterium]